MEFKEILLRKWFHFLTIQERKQNPSEQLFTTSLSLEHLVFLPLEWILDNCMLILKFLRSILKLKWTILKERRSMIEYVWRGICYSKTCWLQKLFSSYCEYIYLATLLVVEPSYSSGIGILEWTDSSVKQKETGVRVVEMEWFGEKERSKEQDRKRACLTVFIFSLFESRQL